ncbi:MAG: Gfo/Idh/MocA family oxidoreductase [Pirellulales bacterium]|nr:Gfo/Idh/MocA family oxidoreductase [Pirellulales bacterium]
MSPSRIRRRDVLKGAAAVAFAPYFWTSRSFAEESADDKPGLACIGVGDRGTAIGRHATNFGNIVACADVFRRNAERFAEPYGGKCQVYEDYRKILDRKDVDVITCGSPDHWHTKISIDAMEAGKDVYCEKPLTLTMDESRLICEAVKRTGRVFQVGTQQRSEFNSMFLKAIAIARSGRLGDTLTAEATIGGAPTGGPFEKEAVPEGLNWDFYLGQAPEVDYVPRRHGWDFRWWLEYSGGQVTDWGAHHTDISLWALGGEQTGVVEVEGKGEFPGLPKDVDVLAFLDGKAKIPACFNVATAFDCKMTLPNGNMIILMSGKGGEEVILRGKKGRIRVNRGNLTGKPIEEIAKNPADVEWLDKEVLALYKGKQPGDHMRNFFECVKDRGEPISDVFSHCNAINACHMANISMLLGRKIAFDREKYAFVGDDQANALMKRHQREPYRIG